MKQLEPAEEDILTASDREEHFQLRMVTRPKPVDDEEEETGDD